MKEFLNYAGIYYNDDLDLFDEHGKKIPWNKAGKYESVTLWTWENKRVTMGRHRVVLLISDYREDHDSLIVNHLDGNTLNNEPSNLEWCDYSRNIKHAYQTGLRTDNTQTHLIDLVTEEVHSFKSLADAARFCERNPSTLHEADQKGLTVAERYKVKIIRTKPSSIANRKKDLVIKDHSNNKLILVSEYSHAAKILGVGTNLLRKYLSREDRWPISGYDVQELIDGKESWPDYPEELVEALAKERLVHCPICVDGQYFGNVKTASSTLGLNERVVRQRVKDGIFSKVDRKNFYLFKSPLGESPKV